jgi:hypothetical protein
MSPEARDQNAGAPIRSSKVVTRARLVPVSVNIQIASTRA